MFLTNILLKKAKSKNILVLMESAVSGHQFTTIRERLADKLELQRFDPYIFAGYAQRPGGRPRAKDDEGHRDDELNRYAVAEDADQLPAG
uniref:Uncharacterized protein n=1 Tax=Anopheles atroparvus TaxID=41427 RepID=A0A182J137_ANOAO